MANPTPLSRRPEPHLGETATSKTQLVLEPSELVQIREWCRSELLTHRFALAAWLILETGMRRGEALGVCYTDVDFDAMTVTVWRQITKQTGEPPEFGPPKTSAEARTISLSEDLLAAIQRRWNSRTVIGMDQLLSCDPDGSAMNPNRLTGPHDSGGHGRQ